MQQLDTPSGRIAVETTGEGPPIVLLHSGGHDRHDFDAVVPALSARHRTIAIDLPGHGSSPAFDPPESTSAARLCEATEHALDALDLPPAVVVGNSVGGMAALRLAARRPERVRGLVLVSPSGFVAQTALVRAFCWVQGRAWVRRTLGMAFARHYLRVRSASTEALLARRAARRRDPAFVAMEAALWRSFALPSSDLAPLAPSIRCPTLVVWGRHDPVLRAHVEGIRVRSLLPHASWADLDAGHVPFAETPDAFLAAVEPFLARVSPSPISCAERERAAPAGARGAPA